MPYLFLIFTIYSPQSNRPPEALLPVRNVRKRVIEERHKLHHNAEHDTDQPLPLERKHERRRHSDEHSNRRHVPLLLKQQLQLPLEPNNKPRRRQDANIANCKQNSKLANPQQRDRDN